MKKVFVIFLVLLGYNAVAQTETALVAAVRAKLDKVKDYTAKGQMTVDVSFINAPQSSVMVYYKSPDKFKVIKDGGISILPKGGVSVNIASLLGAADYTVVPAGKVTFKGTPLSVVKLLPLNENNNVVLTTLFIDAKALLIRRSIVTTKESGSYEMELDYGKYAAFGLPDKVLFIFSAKDYKLPKGVTFEYEKGNAAQKQKKPGDGKGRIMLAYNNYIINKGVPDTVFEGK